MLIRSFPLGNLSDLSKSLMVAHLSWAIWAIRSRPLISSERPERFAHGFSFVLSDLSESLTVAHLIWAKWANEQMSEFPALTVSNPVTLFLYSFPSFDSLSLQFPILWLSFFTVSHPLTLFLYSFPSCDSLSLQFPILWLSVTLGFPMPMTFLNFKFAIWWLLSP